MSIARLAALALIAAAPFVLPDRTLAQPAPAPLPVQSAPSPQPGDAFGEEVTLTPKTIVYAKGSGNWDSAFETLVESFKKVFDALDKLGLKPAGPAMTIHTAADLTSFEFNAAVPVDMEPKGPLPEGIAVGKSPGGRALKFLHRGPYEAIESTYEAITVHMEEKQLDDRDLSIEHYLTDPLTTPEENLVIEIYVPIK